MLLVASVFSLKISWSLSRQRSTSDIIRSVRKSYKEEGGEGQVSDARRRGHWEEKYGRQSHLCLAGAVQDVDQRGSKLLLGPQADGSLQCVAQQKVIGADILGKLFVLLHGEDDDALVACLHPHHGHR